MLRRAPALQKYPPWCSQGGPRRPPCAFLQVIRRGLRRRRPQYHGWAACVRAALQPRPQRPPPRTTTSTSSSWYYYLSSGIITVITKPRWSRRVFKVPLLPWTPFFWCFSRVGLPGPGRGARHPLSRGALLCGFSRDAAPGSQEGTGYASETAYREYSLHRPVARLPLGDQSLRRCGGCLRLAVSEERYGDQKGCTFTFAPGSGSSPGIQVRTARAARS